MASDLARQLAGLSAKAATKEENKKLDDAIAGVLRLLSNYFLQKPAHRVFEYLVRRFKVNEYNVNDVMRCILPYHETNIFVRVVQILRLPGRFNECIRNQGLLSFVCESTQAAVGAGTAGATSFSFAVALVVEVLHRVGRPQPDLVSRVLPLVIDGLRASGNADFQCAAYMILGAIATRAPLDAKGVATLGELLAKHAPQDAADSPAALTCLVLLCEFAGLAPALAALSARHAIGAFLGPFLAHLVEHCYRHANYRALLRELAEGLPAAALRPHAEAAAAAVLARHAAGEGGAGRTRRSRGAPPTARLPLPEELDRAIASALGAGAAPPPPAGQEGGGGGALGGPQAAAGRERVFELVRGTLAGTRHEPVAGGAGTTLLLALEHPEAGVRLAALERVPEDPAPGDAEALGSALLRRAADEEPRVARRALRHPALARLCKPDDLLAALAGPPARARGGRRPRGRGQGPPGVGARGGAPAAAAAPVDAGGRQAQPRLRPAGPRARRARRAAALFGGLEGALEAAAEAAAAAVGEEEEEEEEGGRRAAAGRRARRAPRASASTSS
eukprot:tig00022075_g23663.t1